MSEQKILMCGRHNYGFFSCCSVKLSKILNFVNQHNECPDLVYDSRLFGHYKEHPRHGGINDRFFKVRSDKPALTNKDTFSFHPKGKFGTPNRTPYHTIDFNKSKPWIEHYFQPNQIVNDTIEILNKRYEFNKKNICSVYYRGLDKIRETPLGSYEEYLKKAQEILSTEPDITFFVQTDEQEFLDIFLKTFPYNSFFCEETKRVSKSNCTVIDHIDRIDRISYSILLLSITKVISQSKIVITHSGNCGLWAAFYRNNTENFHQFLNDHWE